MTKKILNFRSPHMLLVILLLSIIILFSLYLKATKDNANLKWKVERMESRANDSHDRLRLIFYRHKTAFIDMADYLNSYYGASFYFIEYKDGKIRKNGNEIKDDEKLLQFFKKIQKEKTPHPEFFNDTHREIIHYTKKDEEYKRTFLGDGIIFYIFAGKESRNGLRYGEVNDFEDEMKFNKYFDFSLSFSIIEPRWGSF